MLPLDSLSRGRSVESGGKVSGSHCPVPEGRPSVLPGTQSLRCQAPEPTSLRWALVGRGSVGFFAEFSPEQPLPCPRRCSQTARSICSPNPVTGPVDPLLGSDGEATAQN